MRAAAEDSREWVIKQITYFEHETHRFVVGDIEIDRAWISAITPPGASTRTRSLDGRRWACTPGLVSVQSVARPVEAKADGLLQAGITTASQICATARECVAASSRTRVRLFTYLLMNAFARARTEHGRVVPDVHRPEQRVFEQIAAQVARNGGRLLPAIHCPSVVSAHELVYAELFAASLHLSLGFVLSDCAETARAFRDRFYCSETHLLAFLQLLRPGIAIWGSSQLTRHDIEMLRASGARAFGAYERAPWLRRRTSAQGAVKATHDWPTRSGKDMHVDSSALSLAADGEADADALVDAATIRAAAELGDRTCGRIAPGMRADLCLFSMTDESLVAAGSEAFLQLFELRRPDAVLIGGKAACGAISEGEPTPPCPREVLTRPSALGLAASS